MGNDTKWARYVRRVAGTNSPSEIEGHTSIGQSSISRWMSGTSPSPAHAAKFAQSYGRNVLEAFVAADFITPEEAGMPPRVDVSFETIVDDDPALTDNAKIHLKNQYGLLRSASAHSMTAQQIQEDPDLDEATKARLLERLTNVTTIYSTTATVVEQPFTSDPAHSLRAVASTEAGDFEPGDLEE